MKFSRLLLLALAVLATQAVSLHAEEKEEGFKSIFNGKDLTDWDGDKKFWSVQDGAITGTTTKENPTNGNTFIVWTGGETGDFELKLQYKIVGGNSGIQYRSFGLNKNDKWRIGGYQADFEAGKTYSGILYGEAFRGILANRGQKTELVIENGKFKVKETGKVGDSNEIQSKIKNEDWNEYHIVAKGFTFKHYINGVQTIECVDNDEKARRASGVLALQLHAGPPMKVQFKNIRIKGDTAKAEKKGADAGTSSNTAAATAEDSKKKKIVFVAGNPSHGFWAHDHKAGCNLLADQLNKSGLGIEAVVTGPGWPKDQSIFDGASAIVVYSDGGGGHPMLRNLKDLDAVLAKGVGFGCIHYAVEVPRGSGGEAMLKYTGGYFETKWSVNPHWTLKDAKLNTDHPITRGVKPFGTNDEWYYHMRFRGMDDKESGLVPILSALPPAETVTGRWKPGQEDGNHNGNQHVYKAVVENKELQHVMWARQRTADEGGGRGFGFTGGHNHQNWGNDNHRTIVLNAIAWIAKVEIPKDGVPNKTPTVDEMLANHDEPVPANFDRAKLFRELATMNGRTPVGAPPAAPAASGNAPKTNVKPAFASKVVDPGTPGHATDVSADITGAKELYLVVTDGGDGFGCDWAAWVEPRLVDKDGKETKLTELKWKSASSDHGQVNVNKNSGGQPQKVNGYEVKFGIGTHANSVIAYDLPKDHAFVKFTAKGGLDEGGSKQGCGSTIQFYVYTSNPGAVVASAALGQPAAASGPQRDPENAVAGLEVHEALQVELFAAEPLLMNPSNIDIDHKGRIWVAEIVNYRGHKGKRPEGDRIIILEDKDGDGKVDGEGKVFYQDKDFNSPHGVTVFATPDGKNTKVIVSIGDKVLVMTDEDGDDKADKVEPLFTGISGTQHDHGIHQVIFGPDGKLYFNFGNSGNQIKDKNGKQIVDKAGNEVKAGRKPYQEGMVFRCNMDGSEFETLGWNFRNNWMNTVDSFGASWQSDNDDDGNKGVRINFVMEFGNYGYKDEITGAGWGQKRTNLEKDVPSRHWHLNDPGVVPTLLLTGGGSPTGITMYEATLLPKEFHGQMIHCDAGPNVVRAYPVKKDGAGYTATMLPIVTGTKDKWFRPADVKVAPDGSLIIADWYDPGVGGHAAGDIQKGRLFRVTPKGHKGYKVPQYKFDTIENCIAALKSPTPSVRYVAWTALHAQGKKAQEALVKLRGEGNEWEKARALWLLGKIEGNAMAVVTNALTDTSSDIRCLAIRLARQTLPGDVESIITSHLAKETDPAVLRECAVAIRHSKSEKMPQLWAALAIRYEGKDRWYLEALGLASDLRADECFAAYHDLNSRLDRAPNVAAYNDIVWRVRAKACLPLLVKIITDKATKEDDKPRYLRAFDFHPKSAEKDKALAELLTE